MSPRVMTATIDSIALSRRAHAYADHHIRQMMKRSGVMLTGEDRDAVMRLASDAFALGYLACIEDVENERTVRDGVQVLKALHRVRHREKKKGEGDEGA